MLLTSSGERCFGVITVVVSLAVGLVGTDAFVPLDCLVCRFTRPLRVRSGVGRELFAGRRG